MLSTVSATAVVAPGQGHPVSGRRLVQIGRRAIGLGVVQARRPFQIGPVDAEPGDPPGRVVLEAVDGRRLSGRWRPGVVDLGQIAVGL